MNEIHNFWKASQPPDSARKSPAPHIRGSRTVPGPAQGRTRLGEGHWLASSHCTWRARATGGWGWGIPDSSMFLFRNRTPQNLHVASFSARLTFHIFLDVVHQGLDGIGEVPGVLLDADLDQAPATDCTLLLLFELWGRKGTQEQERDS